MSEDVPAYDIFCKDCGGLLSKPVAPSANSDVNALRCHHRTTYGQLWARDTQESELRAMYTDDEGQDWDILDMRDALISIRANTKPTAVSLSPPSLIKAIYEICCKAMP